MTASTVVMDLWALNLLGFRIDRFVSWATEPSAVAHVQVTL